MEEYKRSDCCGAMVYVGGEGITHYHVCTKCGKACDTATKSYLSGETNTIAEPQVAKSGASGKIVYKPERCECCRQSKTYLLPIDLGTVLIVKAIANAIREKRINIVHPRDELEGKTLTSNQVGNLTRPRAHGLIAKIKGNPGNYCLTTKGAEFLRGKNIPKYAIMSKVEGHQVGYYMSEIYGVNVRDFSSSDEQWEGINYIIEAGRVVIDNQI